MRHRAKIMKTVTQKTDPSSLSREQFVAGPVGDVLIADWRRANAAAVRRSLDSLRKLLLARNDRTLILFEVSEMRWDAKLPFEGIAWMQQVNHKVARAALVGVSGLQQAILSSLRTISRHPLPVFATRAEAMAWLI